MSSELCLVGIDPGIKDTAMTSIILDFDNKELQIRSDVWTGVTSRVDNKPVIDPVFLKDIRQQTDVLRERNKAMFLGIEGYRQRGMDIWQDQAMLALVVKLEERIPFSKIVDNVGMKQIVPVPLLKLFHVSRFPKASNHADRVSAARVALRRGIENDNINILLSDYVLDNTEGREWSLVSMQTV